ncbi:MAG: LysR family transcriptional regulator [Pseudomonadota bacterium]
MYSIADLRTFVVIAETGGVTAAARRLGISAATASHRLSKLEAALRLTLFHRNSRVVVLTAEGQVFLDRVQPILADLSQAERDAGSGAAALTGVLRATMSPWILSRFILPALPAFRRAHPRLTFEFLAVDRYVSLVAEGQDCGIRVGQLEDSALVARKLCDTRRILCGAPALLDTLGPLDTPETVIAAPWVTLPWQRRLAVRDASGRRRDVTIQSSLMVSNSDMLTECAVLGLGLAIKSRLAVTAELDAGRLVEIDPNPLWAPAAPISFIYTPETRTSEKTKLFGALAKTAFEACGSAAAPATQAGPRKRR